MTKRLTAQHWIDFALTTLAQEGSEALKADILSRRLKVSRGSFYWHFADLADFHRKVIEQWKQLATEAVIVDIERFEDRAERLKALLRRAFGHRSGLEDRMRAWADTNADAASALAFIDRRRCEYIARMLIEAGAAKPSAANRAQLLYWAYLGASLNRTELVGRKLEETVADLATFALQGR